VCDLDLTPGAHRRVRQLPRHPLPLPAYNDWETGLYNLRARLYDPTTGTFLTRDPITPLTRSAYGYVDGDPLNRTDPSGLWSIDLPGDWCLGNDENCDSAASGGTSIVQQGLDIKLEDDWGTRGAGVFNVGYGSPCTAGFRGSGSALCLAWIYALSALDQ
jgi:RHS repeat-associated protein